MPATFSIPRPEEGEFLPYYGKYIALVEGDDALAALQRQIPDTLKLLSGLDEKRALHRYAPGKWSVKDVIVHVTDAERVFAYRAMRFAREDQTPLPGFDEVPYASAAAADSVPLPTVIEGLRAIRAASIALFSSLEVDALTRRGQANDSPVTVRALAWIMAGHEKHHVTLLRERYGLGK
jgi:DinB superfamily